MPTALPMTDDNLPAVWRPMVFVDMPRVLALGAAQGSRSGLTPGLLSERLILHPDGCHVAISPAGDIVGYVVAHPSVIHRPPARGILLTAVPTSPDSLFVEDLLLRSDLQGRGLGRAVLSLLDTHAAGIGAGFLAVMSTREAFTFWSRHDFVPVADPRVGYSTSSYGAGACYMIRRVPVPVVDAGRAA